MSNGSGAGPLVPTFHGFVHNSMDGLVLFEACLSGKLHHVPRRPHDRERSQLIKSGNIFIYEENASGIKRWTDGVAWSPSRILGNFLIYRELEKPFPPGEKKRAMKRKRASMSGEPYPRRPSEQDDNDDLATPLTPPTPNSSGEIKSEGPSTNEDKELERSLIGSLVDSYGFRPDGLVKKTMSISVNGISHHMVSYYKVEDVKGNKLARPLTDPRLDGISVRPELYLKQNFRAPVEESEQYAIDGQMHAHPQMMYSSMAAGAYNIRPGQYFAQQSPMYGSVNSSTAANLYGGVTATSWPAHQVPTSAITYVTLPAYSAQAYTDYHKHGPTQAGVSAVKTEASQPSLQTSYAGQYAPDYSTLQRASTQHTPSLTQPAYQTPVQQGSATFGTVGAHTSRPSYGHNVFSPTSNTDQAHSLYAGATAQQYAVRSPTQSYTMQSAPASTAPHLMHPSGKSPGGAAASNEASAHAAQPQIPYRSAAYAVQQMGQPGHAPADMSGLGISSHNPYSGQPQNGQGYAGYAPPSQAFRSLDDGGPARAGAQFSR